MVFSIIIPIYKVQDYLEKCVNSVCNQTYREIEIILVDDGSPDNCPSMCDEYARLDSRIKVIHKENGGLSDARNRGMAIATGDYILFVDSDDYIETDTCERFLPFAKKRYDILIGDAIVEGGVYDVSHISSNGVFDGVTYYKKALREQKAPVVAWINAYSKEFLKNNNLNFKFGILHEDVEFTPRAFLVANTVVCTHIPFYHYMIRSNSITTKKDKRKNNSDLYHTCLEHEAIFRKIQDEELKNMLLDSLVKSYLSLFQESKAYQYGEEYIHKDFCRRNAYEKRTKWKSKLFAVSPRLYWYVNVLIKNIN